ncbi:MAG: hypothetical protein AAB036_00420 [Elusimicrobiota bacterium]
MNCPQCRFESQPGAPECPKCGLIFAKFQAQKEREKRTAAEFMAMSQAPAAATPPSWVGRAVAGGFLFIWMGGLIWYYVETLNSREERIQSQLRERSRAAAESRAPR